MARKRWGHHFTPCFFLTGISLLIPALLPAQSVPKCSSTSVANWQNVAALKGTVTISGSGQSTGSGQTLKSNVSATIQFTAVNLFLGIFCAAPVSTFEFEAFGSPNQFPPSSPFAASSATLSVT